LAKVEKKTEEKKVEKKAEEKKVEPKKVEAKKVETAVKTEVKMESKVTAAPVPKAATDAKADAKVEASAEPKATEVKAKADEAKVEQPAILAKADKAPAVEPKAAPPLLTSSAADVYARVNFLLNRMDADQKKRNHVEEPSVEEEPAKVETPAKAEAAAAPVVRTETPKVEAPKVEAKVEAKVEVKKAPKVEAKKVEAPKAKAAPVKKAPAPTAAPKEEDSVLDSTVVQSKHSEDPFQKTNSKVANWVAAPKEAATEKVTKSSRALTVDEQREADFPRDWMKNDVKYNADHDKMADREQSIEDQVKAQREWNTKGEAWIQTKIFHLRGWGQMAA
jgi:hypothetical protein